MIKLIEPMAGTDINGKPFSCLPGETVTLDKKSEENLIKKGIAKKAGKK